MSMNLENSWPVAIQNIGLDINKLPITKFKSALFFNGASKPIN